jgi:hypothetical protein
MIEYTINSSESATLLFTKDQPGEEDYSGQDGQFPWESKLAIERPEVTGRAAWSNVKAIERLDIVMRNGFHRKLLYGILCATFLWPNHNDKDIDDIRAVLLSCAMVTNVNFNQEILALTELASREEDRRSNLDILNALVLERSLHEDEKTVGLDEQFLQYCQLSSCRLPLQWKGMNIARCSRGHEWGMYARILVATLLTFQIVALSAFSSCISLEFLKAAKPASGNITMKIRSMWRTTFNPPRSTQMLANTRAEMEQVWDLEAVVIWLR